MLLELELQKKALARAAQTLEELCRMDEYCPYRHQPVPREWRLDECSKCSYSNIPRPGLGVQPDIVHHDKDFRTMCWILYFHWEAKKEMKNSLRLELEEKYLLISILTSAKRDTIKLLSIDRQRELDPKFEQLLNEKIDLINSLLSKLDNLNVKDYCTQNNGECSSCSLVSYGHDCMNNLISK